MMPKEPVEYARENDTSESKRGNNVGWRISESAREQ